MKNGAPPIIAFFAPVLCASVATNLARSDKSCCDGNVSNVISFFNVKRVLYSKSITPASNCSGVINVESN